MFLEILQNSQENTRASLFLIRLQDAALGPATLIKRGSGLGVFLWNLRNFQEHLFYRTPPVAASELLIMAVPVCQVTQKEIMLSIEEVELIVFSLYAI